MIDNNFEQLVVDSEMILRLFADSPEFSDLTDSILPAVKMIYKMNKMQRSTDYSFSNIINQKMKLMCEMLSRKANSVISSQVHNRVSEMLINESIENERIQSSRNNFAAIEQN